MSYPALDIRAALQLFAPTLSSVSEGQERSELYILLEHVWQKTRSELMTAEIIGTLMPPEVVQQLSECVERRVLGVPVQYIIGSTFFCGLEFNCAPETFIPRPETELLVHWLEKTITLMEHPRVLDLCSGTGIIAIMAALRGAEVTAVEIHEESVYIAQQNAQKHNAAHIKWQIADVHEWLACTNEKHFDVIVSNPPYVPSGTEINITVAHDPSRAVFSGVDGLDCIRTMVPQIPRLLAPGGHLGIEHDASQGEQMIDVLEDSGFNTIVVHQDLAGYDRFTTAIRP